MLVYNVEFLYSNVKQYAANVISMEILSQVDPGGHNSKTVYEIVDYKQGEYAVSKFDSLITNNRGVRNIRQTTIGWKFIIQWKYVTTTWMPLNILK